MANNDPTQQTAPMLPLPEDPITRPLVIYDGDCRFCTRSVKTLFRLGGGSRLCFISLHDPIVSERYPDLTHARLMDEMVVIDLAGNRYGGASAFRFLTRQLPGLWLLAPLMHIPFSLPVWSFCYRQIARIRYRFGRNSCDGDSCKIHFH
ncbi:MAG: thiol-disulfide oxidoreductase DCC family protein [Pirellulales bacterium]|jgi:predicted DCC family thiol-disulfide oxidoreductase YuxK